MAISSSLSGNDPIVDMNTTPLIDVLLVLLIMFIITLPLMTHSTSLQIQGAPSATMPASVRIDIDFDGVVVWNGSQVASLAQLEQLFQAEARKSRQPDIDVRPDPRAAYDTVAQVLAIAQRSGMKRIGVH